MNKLMNIKIPTTFLVYIGLFLFSLALTISAMLWFNKYAKYFIKESSIVESSAVFFSSFIQFCGYFSYDRSQTKNCANLLFNSGIPIFSRRDKLGLGYSQIL